MAGLAEKDIDGDGNLSFDELMEVKLAQFEQTDTNDDGVLTIDETLAHDLDQ